MYRAFISYSHTDNKWGDWLHKALETYRVPKALVGEPGRTGPVPKRLYPIFRDREELPTATSLSEQIERALEHSEYLIVICSPRSAQSMWVNQEVLQFKRLGRSDRILAIIVEGEPNASDKPGIEGHECFPPALRYMIGQDGELCEIKTEPIAADARKHKDGRRAAQLKLLAGLLGVRYDLLAKRDQRRRRARNLFSMVFISLAFLAFAGLWFYGETGRKFEEQVRLLEESQRLADLSKQESDRGFHDRAMLLALNALPGNHGGQRQTSSLAIAALERATYQNHLKAVFSHQQSANRVYLNADESLLLVVLDEGEAQLWNFNSLEEVRRIRHGSAISHADFSSNDSFLLTVSDDNSVVVWDVHTGSLVSRMLHFDRVTHAEFVADGERVLSSSADQTIGVWDVVTGYRRLTITHDSAVRKAIFLPRFDYIVAVIADSLVISEAEYGKYVRTLEHDAVVTSIDIDPSERYAVAGLGNGSAWIWDIEKSAPLHVLETVLANQDYERKVFTAIFNPDSSLLATSGNDGRLEIWDATSGERLAFMAHSDMVWSMAFSRDSSMLLSASRDGTARIWNPVGGSSKAVLMHDSSVRHASFDGTDKGVLTASLDGSARLWSVHSLSSRELHSADSDRREIIVQDHPIHWRDEWSWISPCGRFVVETGPVDLQDVLRRIRDDAYIAAAELFDARGVSAVVIRDADSRMVLALLPYQTVSSRRPFSPDGDRMLTISTRPESGVSLWNVTSQSMIHLFPIEGDVYDASFGEDGSRIAISFDESEIRQFVSPANATTILASPFEFLPAGRTCLTPEERSIFHLNDLTDEQWIERRCPQFASADRSAAVHPADGNNSLARGDSQGLKHLAFLEGLIYKKVQSVP